MKVSAFYTKPRHMKQRKPKKTRLIAAIAVAVAAFGALLWFFQRGSNEDANITYIGSIPVTQSYLPEGSLSRPGTKRDIRHIVIHETDNFNSGAGAKAHNDFLRSQADTQELSWHYTVDDFEIYHNLPDDEAAYHASDKMKPGGGNMNGIGIELCVNEDGDFERTLENAVQLTATLMHAYGLRMNDVKKHQDFSEHGKICPARLIEGERWDEFLENVQAAYTEMDEKEIK